MIMASRRPASPADSAPAAKKTRRAFNIKFGVDLTAHMAEWWEQQAILYKTNHKGYHDKVKKEELLRQKVNDLKAGPFKDDEAVQRLDIESLRRWMKTKRDAVTRRPVTKSGQAREVSAEMAEIRRLFGFLKYNSTSDSTGFDNLGRISPNAEEEQLEEDFEVDDPPQAQGSSTQMPSSSGTVPAVTLVSPTNAISPFNQ